MHSSDEVTNNDGTAVHIVLGIPREFGEIIDSGSNDARQKSANVLLPPFLYEKRPREGG